MKAAVYKRYGPPEVISVTDIQEPAPRDNELLIRVRASTVNRTDCGFRSADYFITRFFSGLWSPKKPVLGNEFAGEVVKTGSRVSQFRTGDRVFGYNDKTFGGHAEYMTMAEDAAVATIPHGLDYSVAAAMTEGAHYALCDLRAARIRPGQKYLINGATGAIGSAAVQLAKYFGAEVTAVCRGEHMDLVRSLGADDVIDYTRQDFTQIDGSFDVVFDAVGKSSFGKCRRLLKKRGIYKSTELGYMSQNIFLALTTPFLGGKKVLFPIPTISKSDVLFLKELVEKGKFKPVIDRTYKLDKIVEAYRYVESGQKTGNVVIDVAL